MSEPLKISYFTPLDHAWKRMKATLFQPFSLERWFILGFAAFLAGLDGGSQSSLKFTNNLNRGDLADWSGSVSGFADQVFSHAWMIMLGSVLVLAGLVLTVVVLWLSSRGRFIFLDNLVTGGAAISSPWREYAAEGNSLFRWQLVFALICLVVFGLFAGAMLLLFLPLGVLGIEGVLVLPLVVLAGALGFCLLAVTLYVEFFLHRFVVAIMYRERISASEAWSRFKPLFNQHPGSLVVYGLFYLAVAVAGSLALMMGGFLTCCLGLVLLVLPYIGTVVSLPLWVSLRYLDLEFLGQFGPQFQLLGPVPEDPAHRSVYDDGDRTVVGPEDIGENSGGDQTGPQSP